MPKLFRDDRPWLIGQAPSELTDAKPGRAAFSGSSGFRLSLVIGVSQEEMLAKVRAVNLLSRWPGKQAGGKGDLFPVDEAMAAAEKLLPQLKGNTVIIAGRRVASAFGLGDMKCLEIRERDGVTFAFVPHPSGINLWWNSPCNQEASRKLLRSIIFKENLS